VAVMAVKRSRARVVGTPPAHGEGGGEGVQGAAVLISRLARPKNTLVSPSFRLFFPFFAYCSRASA
jgi:hypothetical protein